MSKLICILLSLSGVGSRVWWENRSDFQESANAPIPLVAGQMQAKVFEFGRQCPTSSSTDPYEVSLCNDLDAVSQNDDLSSCGAALGSGSGETIIRL